MEDEASDDSQREPEGGRMSAEEQQTGDDRTAMQARTFTRWINLVLQRSDPPAAVHDLFKDIRDGRILMALLEQLSGSKLLYRFRSPPQRIFRLKNISKVLTFLHGNHVELLDIKASGVVDGDPSVVLNLVWSIILHFQVKQVVGGLQEHHPSSGPQASRESGHPGETIDALLQRVQRSTSQFGLEVHDFGKSWRSGLAFLALVKSRNPELVDLRASYSREPRENLQQAFAIAQRSLGIAPLLEPEGLLGWVVDEPSIITYVSMFFQQCSTTDEVCPGCAEDTDSGSVMISHTIDPAAQTLLKHSEKSSEQQLWKRWSGRNPHQPVGDGASSGKKGRLVNPPSPLDANIASEEIRSWMKTTSDQSQDAARIYKSHFSLSSEEGVYSLPTVEVEEACSPILDLNIGAFQPSSHPEAEKTILRDPQTEERLWAQSGVEGTSDWKKRSGGEMVNNELEGDIRKAEACEDESLVRGQMNIGNAGSAMPGYDKTAAPGDGETKINHFEADRCKKEQREQTERCLFERGSRARGKAKSGEGEEEEEEEEEGAAAVSRGQRNQRSTSSSSCFGICQTYSSQDGFTPEMPSETEALLLLWILTYCCFILHHLIST